MSADAAGPHLLARSGPDTGSAGRPAPQPGTASTRSGGRGRGSGPAGWTGPLLGGLCVVAAAEVLRPLLAGGGWWLHVVATVAVVVLAGALSRRIGVPAPLVVVVQALLGFGWVVASTGTGALRFGLLPTAGTPGALAGALREAGAVVSSAAPPVSVDASMVLLVSGAFVLVAVVVDTLVVTWRLPALTAVVMAAVHVVAMLSAPNGVSAWDFVVSAVALLALLALAPSRGRSGDRTRPAGAAGRLGLVAVAVAVLLPAAAPGLGVGLVYRLGSHTPTADGSGQAGPGTTFTTGNNPLVAVGASLRRGEDVDVLTVRSSDGSSPYLRLRTLDSFNGTSWRAARSADQTPASAGSDPVQLGAPEGLDADVPRTTVTTDVTVADGLRSPFLPVPFPLTALQAPGQWNVYTGPRDVIGYGTTAAGGLAYRTRSLSVDPTPAQLRAAGSGSDQTLPDDVRADLAVPDSVPAVVGQTARSWTAGATTDYDRAVAIQDRFRSAEFTYDITVGENTSGDAMATFLRERRGFCQQYAATMAVMARELGIPARVVTGFLPGTPDGSGNTVVTAHDAHAWPELWFSGVGWVRFEPTPSGQAPTVPAYTQPTAAPSASAGVLTAPRPTASVPADALPDTLATPTTVTTSSRGWLVAAAVLVGVALLLVGPHAGVVLWRRRRRARAVAAGGAAARVELGWDEVRSALVEQGAGWDAAASPRSLGRRVLVVVGRGRVDGVPPADVTDAVGRLVAATERVRYAPAADGRGGGGGGAGDAGDGLDADVATVVGAVRAAGTRRSRLAGFLVPEPLRRLGG